MFVTQFCDSTERLKKKIIQRNSTLNKIFPNPPIIAYKGIRNPSLRSKLVHTKLKPIQDTILTKPDDKPEPNQVNISRLPIQPIHRKLTIVQRGGWTCDFLKLMSP